MIIDSIINIFKNNCDERGIPHISNEHWLKIISFYKKEDIKESLAHYIIKNQIPFPTKFIPEERLIDLFIKFYNKSLLDSYFDSEYVDEKFNYKNEYYDKPLGIISGSHSFNDISDYFQQENRMKCGSMISE